MIQIIKRNEGYESQVETLEQGKSQVSYNSDGHLVIRVIHNDKSDTLIVLDASASRETIQFIGHFIKPAEPPELPY